MRGKFAAQICLLMLDVRNQAARQYVRLQYIKKDIENSNIKSTIDALKMCQNLKKALLALEIHIPLACVSNMLV